MALITGQLAVTTVAPLFTMPPGPCTVVVSVTGANAGFIGTSNTTTTTNGFGIPTNAQPVVFQGYMGSKGAQFYGVSTGCTFSWLISSGE
jgi:hypothetical protein